MQKPILVAKRVGKSVPLNGEALTILKDISLTVHRGESLAIVGRSGSGTSTLLGLLAGLDTPSSGSILLAGQVLEQLSEDERAAVRALHVCFAFQSCHIPNSLTPLENVMLPIELKQMPN